MKKSIVGVMPARGGSKSVPKKNIRFLGDKPLIQYIFETATKSLSIGPIILSTDDEEILTIGRSLGMDAPFKRPAEFATDSASLISVVKHALAYFDSIGIAVDGIISLQPTCPFITKETIEKAIDLFIETGCDSVTTVAEVTQGHPYITKRFLGDHVIEAFVGIPRNVDISNRQVREKAYYLTGGFYLRSRALVESEATDSHFLGMDSRAVIVSEMEAIDINSEFDFKVAEMAIDNWGINYENTPV